MLHHKWYTTRRVNGVLRVRFPDRAARESYLFYATLPEKTESAHAIVQTRMALARAFDQAQGETVRAIRVLPEYRDELEAALSPHERFVNARCPHPNVLLGGRTFYAEV